MSKLTALVVAISLAMGAGLVQAQEASMPTATMEKAHQVPMHHGGYHKNAKKMGYHWMYDGLNLTPAQHERMRTIAQAFRQKYSMDSTMRKHFKEMHNIIAADTFDEAKARTKIEEYSKQRDIRMLARLKMKNEMYNVLTPEQKQEVKLKYEKKWQKMSEHHPEMEKSNGSDNIEGEN